MIQKFADRELLGGIILDNEETLAARLGIFLDLRERRTDAFGRCRLVDERERPAGQRVLPILIQGNDLDRDVPRQRIVFELRLSTVQPSMSGRNTSRETAVGWYCLARSSASAPRAATKTLKPLSRARSISTRA